MPTGSLLSRADLRRSFRGKRVYRTLRNYIRERQRDGAMQNIEPLVVVRAFIGMIIHHSLNNNLWDRQQQLLKISNQAAAREFTNILLHGVASTPGNGRGHSKITQRRKRSNKTSSCANASRIDS